MTVFAIRAYLGAESDFQLWIWAECTFLRLFNALYCALAARLVSEIYLLKMWNYAKMYYWKKQCLNIYFCLNRNIPVTLMIFCINLGSSLVARRFTWPFERLPKVSKIIFYRHKLIVWSCEDLCIITLVKVTSCTVPSLTGIYAVLSVLDSSSCRQVAEEVLQRLPPGSFLVRESRTRAHSFALSMKDPSCMIVHHLILKGSAGYHLKVLVRVHCYCIY